MPALAQQVQLQTCVLLSSRKDGLHRGNHRIPAMAHQTGTDRENVIVKSPAKDPSYPLAISPNGQGSPTPSPLPGEMKHQPVLLYKVPKSHTGSHGWDPDTHMRTWSQRMWTLEPVRVGGTGGSDLGGPLDSVSQGGSPVNKGDGLPTWPLLRRWDPRGGPLVLWFLSRCPLKASCNHRRSSGEMIGLWDS